MITILTVYTHILHFLHTTILLASCYTLTPDENEECVSYQGRMTGDIIGLDDTLDTVALMAQQINSDAVTATTSSIRVLFLGVELDYGETGRDVLPPAQNVAAVQNSPQAENRFTAVGVVMVVGLVAAVLGLIFVIVRRKRASPQTPYSHQQFEDEQSKSQYDDAETGSTAHDENATDISRDVDGDILHNDDNLPESPDEFSREYNFDLGGWMKSELLGIHGASTITAQPSRGNEEVLSDSDNDSWAQTEGTIGSLELRLDPIEAEV